MIVIAICLADITMFSSCEKDPNNGDNDFPLGTNNWNSIACIAHIPESGSGWNVCIMDKEGNNLRKIVDKSFEFPIPTRSNSGEQSLFSMNGLYFVGIDETELTLIEGANGNSGWSPASRVVQGVFFSALLDNSARNSAEFDFVNFDN